MLQGASPALEEALIEILLLSEADLFIGTFSSFFGQLALHLALARTQGFCHRVTLLDNAATDRENHTVMIFNDAGYGLFLIAAKPFLTVKGDHLSNIHPADRFNLAGHFDEGDAIFGRYRRAKRGFTTTPHSEKRQSVAFFRIRAHAASDKIFHSTAKDQRQTMQNADSDVSVTRFQLSQIPFGHTRKITQHPAR